MENGKKTMLTADFVLLLVAAIWGGGFVAGKLALSGFSPLAILFYRFCGAAVLLGILSFRKIHKMDFKLMRCGMVLGTFQFAGLLIQLIGLQYTTPAKQSFLAASYVVFTPVLLWIISKIRPKNKELLAAIVALCGIGFITLNRDLQIQAGDLITLVFALVFSVQIIMTGKYTRRYDAVVLTFYQFCFSGCLSIAAVLLTHTKLIHAINNGAAVAGVGYLLFINTALAICLQNIAQRYAKPSHAALLLSMESVFGLLFSILVYGERVKGHVLFGCVLVLTAVFISKGVKASRSTI